MPELSVDDGAVIIQLEPMLLRNQGSRRRTLEPDANR